MRGIWASMVKRNRLNICGIFVIVFLTVALGVCFTETDQHMNRGLEELEKLNLEDFSFFPNVTEEEIMDCQGDYWEAAEKRALDLSKVYDFDWEKHEYTVIQDKGNMVRLFPDNRKMNRYKIAEGHRLQENEIMPDYNYAMANRLKIGETFSIGEENYTISAFIVLPDMVSPIVDDTGKMYDKTTQCLAVVSEEKFKAYEDTESIHTIYSGIFRPSSKKAMIYNETGGTVHRLAAFRNRKMQKSSYLKGVKSILLFSKVMVLIFVLFSGFALGVQIQFAYTTTSNN